MTELDQLVRDVLIAADGEVVGRVRLQKIVYLLEQKGLKADVRFQYYHYGPYSRAIDAALERGKAFSGIKEQIRNRQSDGAPFSVFTVDSRNAPEKIGGLLSSDVRRLISLMKGHTATVIELAATIHWLLVYEKVVDWRKELFRRKGPKTQDGRTEQAEGLLRALGLMPF